jgi:hypothetical protein
MGSSSGRKKAIAKTQRLVAQSVHSINQFARELDFHEAAQSNQSVTTRWSSPPQTLTPGRLCNYT